MQLGVIYALVAFTTYGLYPLYWKQLEHVDGMQVAMHRIVWSFVLIVCIITCRWEWKSCFEQIQRWDVWGLYSASSILIFINWYMLVWAINSGYIVETSLGMFITPLVNVMLGVIIFKEKLSRWQWISIFIVCCGVVVCAVAYGRFPWIAITTAVTFGFYSLIKKKAPLVPLHGMMLETLILLPAALIYLIVVECQGTGTFMHTTVGTNLLLVGGGPVTILPLLIFSAAAQLIALSLLGILQYIQPTLQFLIGVLVYNEPLSMVKLVGFILVWVALAIYTADSFLNKPKENNADIVLTPRESNNNVQYIEEI